MSLTSDKIRNVAIIAHVDHGKTTFVDALLKQSGIFRENEAISERVMDNQDQEKERGITISAKCTAIIWNEYKINIIDTPGHADFGGEVERILSMVDGVLLLVDSSEGVMPQTKFVLNKALKLGLKPIVVINKVDRPDERIQVVEDQIVDLFIDLEANDDQLDFFTLYGSGRGGWMSDRRDLKTDNLEIVYQKIIDLIPAPKISNESEFSFLATLLQYDSFVGRILTGKIYSGVAKLNAQVKSLDLNGNQIETGKITKIYTHLGVRKEPVDTAIAGDIVVLAGMANTSVSNTICDLTLKNSIQSMEVDPPTISIFISVNNSPLSGKEGSKVTSTALEERLFKEMENNIAIKIEKSEHGEGFEVSGRGELQLGVFIENMRREGFELSVGRPKVVYKFENNKKLEPIEEVTIDVDSQYASSVISELNLRKGEMQEMKEEAGNKTRLIFHLPARGRLGLRNQFLTETRGTGIMNAVFDGYEEYKGDISRTRNGVLISNGNGEAVAYAIFNLQDRGKMFINPGELVYEGMIVGEHSRENDLTINVLKGKQLTNVRASGTDEAIKLVPPIKMTLEEMMTYIQDDELIEVTPKSIRMRKKILNENERKRPKSS